MSGASVNISGNFEILSSSILLSCKQMTPDMNILATLQLGFVWRTDGPGGVLDQF